MNEEWLGCFAKSMAGRDKDKIYVIMAVDSEYVYLSDGKLKTVTCPKKKKFKHIQIIGQKDGAIELKLKQQKNLMDEEIKRAIKVYISGK